MLLRRIQNLLLLAFLFLLPWQTRYIWHYGELNNGYWEYGTFSIYATEILLWIILLLFFIQYFCKKEFWIKLKEKKSKCGYAFILFFVFLAASTALSNNFWVSYNYVFHILEAMALAVVFSGVIPSEVYPALDAGRDLVDNGQRFLLRRRNDKYALALWAGAVLQGALGVWQFLTQQVWASKWLGMAQQEAGQLGPSVIEFSDQRWLRAYGSFGSPNSLGIYLAILFVLGLVLYLKTESAKKKIIISAGQLFILSGLLLSFSRGAWLAAAAGIICLVVVCHSERSHAESKNPLNIKQEGSFIRQDEFRTTVTAALLKQLIFAAITVVFWLIIFYPVFTARFNLNNRLEIKSISERKGQYAEALSFIKSNPVLGIGPGAYTYALYKKYPNLSSWQYQPIHNIYLLALVEIGLAGVIFLFFLFKRLFWLMVKNNLIYLPVAASLLAGGLFDHWLWSMYVGLMFWYAIFGLVSEHTK